MLCPWEDPKPTPGTGREIAKAVAIAALSAAATGLVTRGLDALKARVRRTPDEAKEPGSDA